MNDFSLSEALCLWLNVWIHGCLWMCDRWFPRRRTPAVKPTHLFWSRLWEIWSAMIQCRCTFFFCLYRIWVLLRLRHWNPCSRSWHNLWRLALWATGHYRYIIALRLAGQRIWLDQWNNWFLLLLALCCPCFLSLCDWTPELILCLSDQCDPNPCLNGGRCDTGADGSFVCSCPEPYTGKKCQTGGKTAVHTGSRTRCSNTSGRMARGFDCAFKGLVFNI